MTRYEIINPSDYCTITAEVELVAAVAVLMIGEGNYGLGEIDGERLMPLFPFGGHEPWLRERGVDDLGAWILAHEPELADALDSVSLRPGAERSSLNDICGYAKQLAGMLRAKKD